MVMVVTVVMLTAVAVTASAEWYQAKYINEYGSVSTVRYLAAKPVAPENYTNYYKELRKVFTDDEIIDEDSDARDLAIVNKLDKQGYGLATTNDRKGTAYVKSEGRWHKLYGCLIE